jgi:PAS domain S-box-containing protein
MRKEKTILVVEDEALIAMREADVLKKHGYRVITVHNGDKAAAAVEREKIDLILMDIDLGRGEMDGTAAAERILRDREVPIVFCTSHAEKEMVEKVKNITSYGYVLKNSGEFVLLKSVGMAFELFEAQKELRNSEAFLDSIIDQSPVSSWISDKNGVLMKLNDASRELFGVSDDSEVVGKYDFHKDDILLERELVPRVEEVFTKGNTFHFEIDYDYRMVRHVDVPGATHRILKCTISPLRNAEGEITNAIFQQIDITDRVKAEEAQELLLKEMNHRIKNNLAIISSLISLTGTKLGNNADLSNLEKQVRAVGLVHEQLYQTEDITHINANSYIPDLLDLVFSSITDTRVIIETDIEEIKLPTKKAVPLGLIVNEIATNAVKHGFSGDAEHRFQVSLKTAGPEGGRCVLTVSNSGLPVPDEVDLTAPKSMGLQLITILTEQLQGSIELQRSPHPKFTVRFPMK